MYLKLNNFDQQIIKLDRNSGDFEFVDINNNDGDVIGYSYLIEPNNLYSEYLYESNRWFQFGADKWNLSDVNVKCFYFRIFQYEYFSIQKKGERKLNVKIKSQPPFIRGILNDPTYDELDKFDDYFFYRVWMNWKNAQKKSNESNAFKS